MKIVLLESLGVPDNVLAALCAPLRAAGHEFVSYTQRASGSEELIARSQGAEVVMIADGPYPDEVVRATPALKLIAVAFTGIDHVGLSACRERGITVCNCAGYSDESVAELTIGLTIDVLRKVVAADAAVRSGATSAGFVGREVCGKTVGIVGTGRIGTRVARLFCACGARVLGYARHENPEATRAGATYVSLDELLAVSDIVSLHLPLNAHTSGWFDANKIRAMKDGAVLVNCARGAIVDNDALAAALCCNKLSGAGIDVFDIEPPLPADYALLGAPNCVFTPHVGFLTQEALQRRAQIEFDNVTHWLVGEPTNVCVL